LKNEIAKKKYTKVLTAFNQSNKRFKKRCLNLSHQIFGHSNAKPTIAW